MSAIDDARAALRRLAPIAEFANDVRALRTLIDDYERMTAVFEKRDASSLDGATVPPLMNADITDPGTFAAHWNAADEEMRGEWLARSNRWARESSACFLEDHRGQLECLRDRPTDHTVRSGE